MDYGIRRWAREEPDRIALEFETAPSVSYSELETQANRFAQLFRSCGLRRGDHVCGILPNGPEVIAAVWGAYRCGLYYTPVAHTFTPRELAYVVDNSDSKLVLTTAEFEAKLGDIETDCHKVGHRFIIGRRPGWQDLEAALAAQPDTPVADETPGFLMMYSSGTTGAPKGIWRPLPDPEAYREGPPTFARDLIQIFDFAPETRYLSPAPLYHAAPLRWSLAITASGGTAYIMDRFDADRALDILETRGITMSQWVPTMFRRMLALPAERRARFSAPAHVAAWHAAAPCPPSLKREMIDWWGPIIHEYYSGSESVGLTLLDTAEWQAHPGSVGRAVKGVLHIVDEDWNELPAGQTGNVYFDPPSKFAYYGEPEKTAKKTSPQGWQTVGEVGYVDADGYLYLTDRQDDMIISGGVNIYPQEIEQCIEAMPEVSECCVTQIPDADFGERPVAFVVPAQGAPGDRLEDLVREVCRTGLGKTKQPYQIRVVDDLPRSDAGKTLRRVLRDQLAQEYAASQRESVAT
ncbi:MAG: AMP-binding protein [Sagittula sp.]|uniref:AMP-binding protein n=1 Tax=Sagittula sp. TaxID=2038081 RepID=UPI004058DF91